MKPFRLLVLPLLLLPLMTWAAPPDAPDASERVEKRSRMMRMLSLAEELELNEAQTLKMADTMRQFDERRRPLLEQVRASAQILRKAAKGDAAAQSQVDQAVQRVFEARTQLTTLERDLYQALAKDLPPQKRAQLAISLARHGGRKEANLMKPDRDGRHARMRWRP
ncbi:hypothetical protein F0U62_12980 [Cystobacter fuscus]|uniref:hypothetical protein n=1 Tax=Cystobacter fuscus TaxID=43 RepID=UPI002B29BDC1|nr:hypothetical protein F0U62_12980 [Cystobacter fuscus]